VIFNKFWDCSYFIWMPTWSWS